MALLFSILLPVMANAMVRDLTGLIEYRYADFTSDLNGQEQIDASHFSQLYSFLYSLEGNLYNNRAGSYNLSLGAQWYDLDAKINDDDHDLTHAKILYKGEMTLAPGGLPFRLNLYSHDLKPASFYSRGEIKGFDTVFDPDILTDVNNGTHQVTGGTLVVGIRNGSYLGRFREILSKYPRLLIDYRQDYVRDMESESPQHYRTRNLAFVSLNKKDNWFHYRFTDHVDYENPEEDFEEKTYLLGTIDHKLIRQWINLTNWIKVSVDGAYSETKTDLDNPQSEPSKRFDINLFTRARRGGTDLGSYLNFGREQRGESLQKNLDVPVFLHQEINPDTRLDMRFQGERLEDRFDLSGDIDIRNSDVAYIDTVLETNRRQQVRIDPRLEIESKSGNEGRGLSWRLGAEAYTNRLHRPAYSWLLGYSLANFSGTGDQGADVSYWEQEVNAGVSTQLPGRFLVGFSEQLQYGSGDYDGTVSRYLTAATSDNLDVGVVDGLKTGDNFRSVSTLFLEKTLWGRVNNRLEFIYDYLQISGADSYDSWEINHSLSYTDRRFRVRSRSRYKYGETVDKIDGFSSNVLGVSSQSADGNKTFDHYTRMNYSPSRNYDAGLELDYYWQSGGMAEDSSNLRIKQEFDYHFFKVNGIVRKLASLEERIEYEQFDESSGDTRTYTKYSLAGSWYPSRITYIKAKLGYEVRDYLTQEDRWVYSLSTGVNWPKLSLDFNYTYGLLDNDAGTEIEDHRWEVIASKTF